jgi:hypothetical protein
MSRIPAEMTPETVNVDGLRDSRDNTIEYLGIAMRQPDGTYLCLANVGGLLCKVQVNISCLEVE